MRRMFAFAAAAAFVVAFGAPAFAKTETVKGQIVDQACYKMDKANAGVDSPRVEERVPNLRNNHQLLAARERDVALVEQMIDVGGQQQTVGAVEALSVRRITPRLDVTGFEVSGLADMRNAAGIFT